MTNWKTELQKGFDAPPPTKKRAFLREFPAPSISLPHVLYAQLGYIQKWVWLLSAAIYAVGILMLWADFPHLLQTVSACAPLLALTIVSESSRSMRCGMAELELSTRFSLKTAVLTRLIPLSCLHPIVLVVLAACSSIQSPLAAGLYASAPFLLTAFLGLSITRKYRSSEAIYACAGAAFAVSLLTLFSHKLFSAIYQAQHLIWWVLAAAALTNAIGRLYHTILFETEELAWN